MARPKSTWRNFLILGLILLVIGGFGFHVGMTDGLGKPEEQNSWSVVAVKTVLGNGEAFQAFVFASYIALLSGFALTTAGGLIVFLDSLLKPHEPIHPPKLPYEHSRDATGLDDVS
jgi:hypothetical protein